ncbi:hypothetical protein [Peteryoungia ipomoeae]|uniref:Uncharacterized protein n=1 Tax=Peteryoungia ipomoeae TaxID=1210932 RepID=A0A4S8NVA3_9HYPH|nr:hypothetical protein [Peteryoungia ipomoeae]THV21560.1 hypothetical protein FAA97_16245 [Peteryoungia ipomoeae]
MNTPMKSASAFDDFVKRLQPTADDRTMPDWTRERDEWLDLLSALYGVIEEFLNPYIENGTIAISYEDIVLIEEDLGEYHAKEMVLQIGRQKVIFKPVGTMLIGTKGRVDVEGTAGRARLLLTDRYATKPMLTVSKRKHLGNLQSRSQVQPPVEWTWKIATMPPQVTYLDLTRDSLFEMVMEVANA